MSSATEPLREIRIWEVQHAITDRLQVMTKEEVMGAEEVLSILHSYLYRTHFQDQTPIDVKALVKTVEELWEISGEILHYKFQTSGFLPSTTPRSHA